MSNSNPETRGSARGFTGPRAAPPPLLVMAHGLGAVRTMRLDAGYACLVLDYPNFGDSEGQPRQLLDIASSLRTGPQRWTTPALSRE